MPSCAAVELALPNLPSSTFPGLGSWMQKANEIPSGAKVFPWSSTKGNNECGNKKLQKIANCQHSEFQIFTKSVYIAERPKEFLFSASSTNSLPRDPTCVSRMSFYVFLDFALATLLSLPSELQRWRPTRVLKEFLLSTLTIGPCCSVDVWAFAQV